MKTKTYDQPQGLVQPCGCILYPAIGNFADLRDTDRCRQHNPVGILQDARIAHLSAWHKGKVPLMYLKLCHAIDYVIRMEGM